jgi:opacity protein-like surface antigen
MKFTALVATTLVAAAGVASAVDVQPAMRALEPAAPNAQPTADTNAIAAKATESADADKKEGWGGPGFGGFGWGRGFGGGYGWGC